MFIRRTRLLTLGTLVSALLIGAAASADTATPSAASGNWQQHQSQFDFMGFTTTYSCQGLEDKLKLLLRLNGAGPDLKVNAPCSLGYGVPDRLAFAYLTFSTLQPGATSPAAAGEWRHVALSPHHPFQLERGDCELIEQFRDKVLPMFATRNLANNVTCVPHQDSGSNFQLSYDVFAPRPVKKP
jgi:hypothetical protein